MIRRRQSTNVEDRRVRGDRLLSSSATKDAVNEVLRNTYAPSGQISRAQKKNAEGLGLSQSLSDAQNQANKFQARRRTRFTPASDREVIKSLTKRKS